MMMPNPPHNSHNGRDNEVPAKRYSRQLYIGRDFLRSVSPLGSRKDKAINIILNPTNK